MKTRAVGMFVLWMSVTAAGMAVAADDLALPAGLDESLSRWVETFQVPSLSVGVIQGDRVLFNRAYGMANLETRVAATSETIYRIGSCSKAFAAAALGILVDRGMLKWTDRVRDHLPEFRLRDAYVTEHATIEDLLTHRMGFRSFDGDLLWYRTGYNAREILERIGRLPLTYEFRTTKGYSNVMYLAVQLLIERVSGMTYAGFLQRNIFEPLGMTRSNCDFRTAARQTAFARPYKGRKELEAEPLDALAAAGGVNASMTDMLKWVGMLLSGGKAGDIRVLSDAVITEFFRPRMINPLGGMEQYMGLKFYLYGLGWNLYPYHNQKIVVHQGAMPGYIANVLLVPEQKLGVVVMCNELSMLSFGVSRWILDRMLNVSGKDWVADALRFDQWLDGREKIRGRELESSRIKGTRPSLSLEEYCGRYSDPYYGDAVIRLRNGSLYLSLEPTRGKLASTLAHFHFDTFRVNFQDPYIPPGLAAFRLGPAGRVAGFALHIASEDFNFENLKFVKAAAPRQETVVSRRGE